MPTFKVDATGPRIDLPERWNIWDTAAFVVRDGGSGLSSVEVILSDPQGRWPSVKRTYAPSGSRYDGQIGWNRRFADDTLAPQGEYRVTVKASDLAGNFSQEEATLVIPAGDIPDEGTIVQPLVEADDPPLETIFTLPPEEPKVVPEPVESVFGGTSLAVINEAWQANSLAAAPPLAAPPGILWGAGALAAMAGMSAYYLQKRREEEEAQRAAVHAQFAAEQAEKERQQKAQAKVMVKLEKQWAEEKFKEQAYEAWKAEDERKKNAAAALLEKAKDTAAYYSAQAAAWLGIDKYIHKPKMPIGVSAEAQQAFQHGGSAAQGWIDNNAAKLQAEQQAKLEKQQRAAQAKDTAASYSSQAAAWLGIDKYIRKPEAPKETAPMCRGPEDLQQEKPWWEKTLDFIDNHQTGASIGVGAVVGLAAIGITLAVVGAVTWPVLLVAAGVAAVAAGVAVATGTVALNTHYERPPETNIWDNIKAGAATAAAFTGVGLFLAGGLLTSTVIGAGNAIASACAANPVACAKAGAVLGLVDPLEELVLTGQLFIETVTGNPRAGETAIELQLEKMDGGAPGNTALKKIREKLALLTDDALKSLSTQGPDAIRAISRWGDDVLKEFGVELASRAGKDAKALKALDELTKLDIRSNDPVIRAEANRLIQEIAENSTHGSGDRFVLGIWDMDNGIAGGYVNDARINGGTYYASHPDIYNILNDLYGETNPQLKNDILWALNEAALQRQIANGVEFDYSMKSLGVEGYKTEVDYIQQIIAGNVDDLLDTMRRDALPARLKEVQLLLEAGYTPHYDNAMQVIHWVLEP